MASTGSPRCCVTTSCGRAFFPGSSDEAEEIGDRVVLSVEGPHFPPVEGQPDDHRRSLVFTFEADRVVRIESVPTRELAFQIART